MLTKIITTFPLAFFRKELVLCCISNCIGQINRVIHAFNYTLKPYQNTRMLVFSMQAILSFLLVAVRMCKILLHTTPHHLWHQEIQPHIMPALEKLKAHFPLRDFVEFVRDIREAKTRIGQHDWLKLVGGKFGCEQAGTSPNFSSVRANNFAK